MATPRDQTKTIRFTLVESKLLRPLSGIEIDIPLEMWYQVTSELSRDVLEAVTEERYRGRNWKVFVDKK